MITKNKAAIAVGTLVVLALGVLVYEIWQDFGASSVESETAIPVNPTVPGVATMGANGYTADIGDAVPAGFTGCEMEITKLQNRSYVGELMGQPVSFTLGNLPKHASVHVAFDLVLTNSWNGSNTRWGPDIWMCDVDGGPQLMRTTFSNCGFFDDNNEQNFPDEFPLPAGEQPHPAWTGVLEHGTLGDMHSWGGPDRTFDCSAIYRMDWTFPHTDSKLKLNFSTKTTERDKVYGFLSFHVEALPAAEELTDDQFKKAWLDVNSADAVAGNAAVWRMIAAGDAAVKRIEGQDLSGLKGFPLTRVRHVLQVVGSGEAKVVEARLAAAPGGGAGTGSILR